MSREASIILVTTSFPMDEDGREAAGSFVLDFCEELGKHADLTVIAPSLTVTNKTYDHFRLASFRVPTLPLSLLNPADPRNWLNILATLRAGQTCLEQTCATRTVDHIFCLWALPCGYWARTMHQRHGIPYSTWALGSDIWSLGRIPIIKHVLRTVLRDSRHCFADGIQLKNDVERISGRSCDFLPSARRLLDTPSVKPAAAYPPYKIAYLGRWHPNKGIDLLGQSLEMLNDEAWRNISAIRIAGGGPMESCIKTHVLRLKQRGRPVILEGYKDRKGAQELLQWADFIVIPSRIESIPVIFSDAMQAHCAVIASPVGDLPYLISKYQVGISSQSTEPADLASALENALMQGPASYEAGISRAAADFRIEEIAAQLNAALNS